jgi:hypothetical protein
MSQADKDWKHRKLNSRQKKRVLNTTFRTKMNPKTTNEEKTDNHDLDVIKAAEILGIQVRRSAQSQLQILQIYLLLS